MRTIVEAALVDLLENLYAFERTDEEWLSMSLSALGALCGDEHHYVGYFYDASNVEEFRVWNACTYNAGPEVGESFRTFMSLTTPAFLRATLRSLYVGSARRTALAHLEPLLAERERLGWGDIYNINGLDPSGVGCLLTIGCREREFVVDHRWSNLYRRIATHLAAAFRYRRRFSALRGQSLEARVPGGAEAILDGSGRFVHAEGEAQSRAARERIRGAAAEIDAFRAARDRRLGREALDGWHPLIGARWTIVDHFEQDGTRYVVAQENQIEVAAFSMLTDRERQVVVHAALGHSDKQVAYALGISEPTVRVLIARAASRLGVRTRKELLEHAALASLRHVETSSSPASRRGDS